jgi:hypothetical protein
MSTEPTTKPPASPPLADATRYASDAELAECCAQTAANFIKKGWWCGAYIELHHAAEICWRKQKEAKHGTNNREV